MGGARSAWILAAAVAAIAGGCSYDDETDETARDTTAAAPAAPMPQPAAMPADSIPFDSAAVRFVVDVSDRKLYVLKGQDTVRTDPVAVGTSEYPTKRGEWKIDRVDWNPDWTPPPGEDWAEDRDPQPPGSAKNPMGRARIVFNPPLSIHGTKERESLGKAASHGSIRVANETVVALGRLAMEEGGAPKPPGFFDDVAKNRTKMVQVDLPRPIPIRVQD